MQKQELEKGVIFRYLEYEHTLPRIILVGGSLVESKISIEADEIAYCKCYDDINLVVSCFQQS